MKKKTLTLILLAILLISPVLANSIAILYYNWTVQLQGATPLVVFYKWSDGSNATTITLSHKIYKSILERVDNETYGIKNGNTTSAKTIYLWVNSCNATTWFSNFTVRVTNGAGVIQASWTTTNFASVGESTAVSWSQPASAIYTIRLVWQGTTSVVIGQWASIALQLKTSE